MGTKAIFKAHDIEVQHAYASHNLEINDHNLYI